MRAARRSSLRYAGLVTLCLVVATTIWSGTVRQSDAQPPPPGEEISLGLEDEGTSISLAEGQVLSIILPANPTTGYTWEVANPDPTVESSETLRLLGEVEFQPESDLLGAPGLQTLRFEQLSEGVTTIHLVYHRPWEVDSLPARTFSAQVRTAGPSDGATPASAAPSQETVAESTGAIDVGGGLGLPTSYNWCSLGGCTPVKDQGLCGSCWAFATVGVLESNIRIHDVVTRDLSEQYLLSCNTDGWDCNGGLEAHDYHWWKTPPGESTAGSVYEADFPYVAWDAPCNPPHQHREKIGAWSFVENWWSVPSAAELKQALLDHGPVLVGVCAGPGWVDYTGGVFTTDEASQCAGGANHAVVLVGWDDNQGTSGLWYLRNSWGSGWGESGYMRMAYGISNLGQGASYIVYPPSSAQRAAWLPLAMNPTAPPPNTLYSVADACVVQGYPTMNAGDTIDMWVGYDDYLEPDGKIVRSLVKFNLSAIPSGTSINKALLRVYLASSWDFPGETRTITTYRITSSWSEMGVTWNNQPSFSTAYGSAPVTHGEWGWYSFNVTTLVRGWINGTIPSRGVMLRGPEHSGSDSSWKGFSTREDYGYEPRLAITYSASGASSETEIGSESPGTGEPGRTIIETLTSLGSASVDGANLCGTELPGNKCLAMQ